MARALLVVALELMILANCPLHAQESADTRACDHMAMLDLSTIDYVPGELLLSIKKGNDEIVAELRLASERKTVEIGRLPWDELSADLGLIRIEAFPEYTEQTRRLFLLVFPEERDLQQAIVSYCALPYVDFVEIIELLRTAVTQTTWSKLKLEVLADPRGMEPRAPVPGDPQPGHRWPPRPGRTP